MILLQVLHDKEIDIWIAVATTLLGLALGTAIDIIRERMKPEPEYGAAGAVKISITNITNMFNIISREQTAAGGGTNGGLFYALLPALIIFFVYARFRGEWVSILTLLTILTLSLWIGSIIHGAAKGRFTILAATYYLSLCLAFGISSVFIEDKIQTPSFAPKNFPYLQDIITEYGLNGISKYFLPTDYVWFAFHLAGAFLFLLTCLRMMLSVVNLFTVCSTLSGAADQGFFSWILRRTIAYRLSPKNVLWTIVSVGSSYYLVAGEFYMWYTYKMPQQVSTIVYQVFNGTH